MKIKHIALAALAAGIAAPALAQTGPEPFSGPFVGVEAGWQQDRLTANINAPDFGFIGNETAKDSGLRYGGFAGFDFRAGTAAVVGLEVGVAGRTGGFGDDADGRLKLGRTFDVTGRAGALVSPTTLVYARGGYSNARYSLELDGDKESSNRDGWTIGAGVESMLGANASARLEYRYADYGSLSAADAGNTASLSARRHVIAAGLAFRF